MDQWRLPIPAPGPGEGGELDPEVAKLVIAVMHITCFLALMGLGYQPEQAITIAIGVGLGTVSILDHFRRGGGVR